jgi:small subunit ribosomal protein S17
MADDEKKIEETEATPEVEAEAQVEEVSDTTETVDEAATVAEVSDTPAEAPAEEAAPEPAAVEPEAQVEEVSDTTAEAPAEAPPEAPAEEAAPEAPAPKTKSLRHVPRPQRRQRSKLVREKPATRKPITRTEKPGSELGRRQERRGVVVSDKGDKTIVVKVDVIKSHPKYKKVVRRSVKFHAHDEQNTAGIGDTVRIVETRPLSKQKRWRLAEVVEKAR